MMVAFRLMAGRYQCTCHAGYHTEDKASRLRWGCDKPARSPVFADPITGRMDGSKNFDLYRCPAGQVGPEWDFVIATWSAFGGRDSFGPLPVAGGWLDQTQWFADAHAILSGERNLEHDRQRKEAEQKRKTETRRGR